MSPRPPPEASPPRAAPPAARPRPALVPGSLGFSAPSQLALNALAHRHRFTAVEPLATELADASPGHVEAIRADLAAKGLAWGATGLTIEFRRDEAAFQQGLAALPRLAAGLGRAGASRIGTWIPPSSDELTFRPNLDRHAARLRAIASILGDHGVRLGLEYVGTPLAVAAHRHPFIHTLAGARELVAAIGTPNVGLVLDSWHWWISGGTPDGLRALSARDIVGVDLNDAPRGVPREQQRDKARELPLATGVIDLRAFLTALHDLGYDGPVRCEPFNAAVNALGPDQACAAASAALHQALDLLPRT